MGAFAILFLLLRASRAQGRRSSLSMHATELSTRNCMARMCRQSALHAVLINEEHIATAPSEKHGHDTVGMLPGRYLSPFLLPRSRARTQRGERRLMSLPFMTAVRGSRCGGLCFLVAQTEPGQLGSAELVDVAAGAHARLQDAQRQGS